MSNAPKPRSVQQIMGGVSGAAAPAVIDNETHMDVDMFHAMSARDNALIEDEIFRGGISGAHTYSFPMQGKTVVGVSVIGARHLAQHYGGLEHRLVSSISKVGPLFTITTYAAPGVPKRVEFQYVEFMADKPDFYTVVVEVCDVKKGLKEQVEVTEPKMEKKRDGGEFERPHYQRIAQSKAQRNGILNILPQDLVEQFKQASIAAKDGKNIDLSKDLMAEKRSGILRFAIGKGIPVNRLALDKLTFEQIMGLRAAAEEGVERFRNALGVLQCLGASPTAVDLGLIEQEITVPVVDLALKRGEAEPVPVPGAPLAENQEAVRTPDAPTAPEAAADDLPAPPPGRFPDDDARAAQDDAALPEPLRPRQGRAGQEARTPAREARTGGTPREARGERAKEDPREAGRGGGERRPQDTDLFGLGGDR